MKLASRRWQRGVGIELASRRWEREVGIKMASSRCDQLGLIAFELLAVADCVMAGVSWPGVSPSSLSMGWHRHGSWSSSSMWDTSSSSSTWHVTIIILNLARCPCRPQHGMLPSSSSMWCMLSSSSLSPVDVGCVVVIVDVGRVIAGVDVARGCPCCPCPCCCDVAVRNCEGGVRKDSGGWRLLLVVDDHMWQMR